MTGRNGKPIHPAAQDTIDARYRVPIKEDPVKVARRRRIEQLLEEQREHKEDPLWMR